MAWEGLLEHTEQIAMLRRSLARGRVGHTYLLAGPAGIGKRRFALSWAECLLCNAYGTGSMLGSCGVCDACQQVRALTHPDLLIVERPEGKSDIPIELLLGPPDHRGKSGLCHDLALRPMSATRKVAIIDDADLLNDAGANALLKTLEEPPAHSLLILIAPAPDALLPTIQSRCQVIRFSPLSAASVQEILLREEKTDNLQEAAEVAALCEGSLETASQLLNPQLRAQRLALYDGLAKEQFQSPQLTAQMLEGLEQAGAETSLQRMHASWLIRFCIEFYRRALRRLTSGDDAQAPIPQIGRFVAGLPGVDAGQADFVGELLERCMAAERQLESKVSIPLCLEALFNDLGRIGRGLRPPVGPAATAGGSRTR